MARYYTRFEPDPRLARIYSEVQRLALIYRQLGQTGRAIRAIDLMEDVMRRLEAHAVRMSADADEIIRRHIETTRVRPRASGRMSSAVKSRPLVTSVPSGAIGVADLDELDKSTPASRMGPRHIPYWYAQEFGSEAAVGRIVPGYFQPGNARAAADQFRVHPFFEQVGPKAPRGTPAMVITRPIEARHFLRDGTRDALALHLREIRRVNQVGTAGILSI